MDIKTPKGQRSLELEREMLDKIRSNGVILIETPKDTPMSFDGFIVRENTCVGIFESKCRSATYPDMVNYGTWLVTQDKIDRCVKIAEFFGVPFFGFLYTGDKRILSWKIWDREYCFDYKTEETETQATVNGGTAKRLNAFLPLQYATVIE